MKFSLTAKIGEDDLKILTAAKECILLAKTVESSIPSQTFQTVWRRSIPFPSNTFSWEENYGAYASKQTIKSGVVVEGISTTPVQAQHTYTFQNQLFEDDGVAKIKETQFLIDNKEEEFTSMTFGLTQKQDGETSTFNPINAIMLPKNQSVTFTPKNIVYIWVGATLENGSVISDISSMNAYPVDLTETSSATVIYSSSKGTFVPA